MEVGEQRSQANNAVQTFRDNGYNLKKIRLTLLGATGSVGTSTLDVLARHPERYEIIALTGASQIESLATLCIQYRPRYAVVVEAVAAEKLSKSLREAHCDTEVLCGDEGLVQVVTLPEVDLVVSAIVGVAGLSATLAAARAGKKILLANKETLVLAGSILMKAVAESGAVLLPIDSEHNAIFQCLPHPYPGTLSSAGVTRLLLTASGGPFRQFTQAQLETVTLHQALKHPNWAMGKKISVDCATLMNKGLEVIEAHWLFNAPAQAIEVVVHPQSVIHSLVEYVDGSMLAQLASPDMRTSIAYALAYPARIESGVNPLDLFAVGRLDFEAPDWGRFPCLRLAHEALRAGGSAPAVLNAANEVAVAAFIKNQIRFVDIASLNEAVLTAVGYPDALSIQDLLEVDRCAREAAHRWLSH